MIKPPGKPGIADYFSTKTTKNDTYDLNSYPNRNGLGDCPGARELEKVRLRAQVQFSQGNRK